MKILSVDDSKAVHSFVKMCLMSKTVDLIQVLSGEEALDKLTGQNKENFDLILLDWEMPGLTGPEVLVKARESGISTPVIMLTSRNKEDDIRMALENGASEYIMKPFTEDLLVEKIDSVVGW
ncbi:MAG: response regulator [Bdellovibrionales bacterium]|nr:response regulator [Bdellovibrionales bacterium]